MRTVGRGVVGVLQLALPGLAGVLSLIGTRRGMLLDPDSATYLLSAIHLRSDLGSILGPPGLDAISVTGQFPPLYGVLVAIVGGSGWGLRIVTALAAGLAVALVGAIVRRAASPAAAATAMFAVIVSRGFVLQLFGFVMSDGLNLCLVLAGLVLVFDLSVCSEPGRRRRLLLAIGTVGALSVLTRYAGVALLITVAASLAVLRPWPRWRRDGTIVIVGALAPVTTWMLLQGGSTNRATGWYGPPAHSLSDLAGTLTELMLPGAVGSIARREWVGAAIIVIATAVAAVALCRISRRATSAATTRPDRVVAICGCFVIAQLAVVAGSSMFFDPLVLFSGRHLLPAWVVGIPLIAVVVDRRWRAPSTPMGVRWIAGAVVAIVLVGAAATTLRSLADPTEAFQTLVWEADRSPTFAAASLLPDDAVISTNRGDLLLALDGRTSRPMPLPTHPATGRSNESFEADLAATVEQVERDDGVVVMFMSDPAWAVAEKDLTDAGLVVVSRHTDGVILRCQPSCGPG